MANTTAEQTRNGVDVNRLTETIDAINQDPELARFRFRASNTWDDGARSSTRIQHFHGVGQEDTSRAEAFELDADEPDVLLGSNQAPNAVEAVLHALASCLGVGFVYNAAAEGIDVRSLEFDVEGELDLRGFLGLSEEVRPGYQNVRVDYRVECDAPDDRVDALCAHVQRTSPVLDLLRNPVEVTVERR